MTKLIPFIFSTKLQPFTFGGRRLNLDQILETKVHFNQNILKLTWFMANIN